MVAPSLLSFALARDGFISTTARVAARFCDALEVAMLPDGTFDVFVVDATSDDDAGATLELALVSGEHKGDVVTLRMKTGGRDPIAIIGLPGTLTVSDGQPSLRIDT